MTPDQTLPHGQPSAARLLRSTLLALAVAGVILVVAVLPAEYGVDPTGLGRRMGLTQMGETKTALAREAAAEDSAAAAEEAEQGADATPPADASVPATTLVDAPSGTDSAWQHVTIVNLAPGQGKEVKLVMTKGSRATFAWASVGGAVNHDTHGDSTGVPNSYLSYRKGTDVRADSGELVAPMNGSHGWYWRNRTDAPVSITLRTRGEYVQLKKRY